METRQTKGIQIAQTTKIRKKDNAWIVPSQTGKGAYRVCFDKHVQTCTCPDCETRNVKCKHIWAVEYYVSNQTNKEGRKVITRAVRVTYSQDWSAYDKAQTQEGQLFLKLLSELCAGIPNKAYAFGRPTLPMADMVFASALKVYSTFSLRRFVSDMQIAKEKSFTDTVCSYSSVSNYMRNPDMKPILLSLIEKSSLPLKEVEKDFCADATGFATTRYKRWFDFKYGKEESYQLWLKAHVMCGAKTNIITSIDVSEGFSTHDGTMFKPLLNNTAKNFEIKEVSADMAYMSKDNLHLVEDLGGAPFIPFRTSTKSNSRKNSKDEVWSRLYHYFAFNQADFMAHYHKRSNAESTFSMMKRKFGEMVRSKNVEAQINEILLKALCHNICVLIQEMHELGINPSVSQ